MTFSQYWQADSRPTPHEWRRDLRAKGPKGEMDALPAVKDCIEGLTAWVMSIERKRLRVVA